MQTDETENKRKRAWGTENMKSSREKSPEGHVTLFSQKISDHNCLLITPTNVYSDF